MKGKKMYYLGILFFVSVIFISCERQKDPLAYEVATFRYPLFSGMFWEYRYETAFFNVQPDTLLTPATMEETLRVVIHKTKTLPNQAKAFEFQEFRTIRDDQVIIRSYYNNADDGFYQYAYVEGFVGVGLPKLKPGPMVRFNHRLFSDAKEALFYIEMAGRGIPFTSFSADSIVVLKPPLRVLMYPLFIDVEWVYRSKNGNAFPVHKKIVGKESVTILEDYQIEAIKVQVLTDYDRNGQWDPDVVYFEYYTELGLVKRYVLLKGLVMMDYQGNEIGTFDSASTLILTRMAIPE
ncbi:MAG: hypothetical protein GXO78_13340 [Calditrichaeota bacterium]|nr:hypothetical protein [Calditrichota bacterium]